MNKEAETPGGTKSDLMDSTSNVPKTKDEYIEGLRQAMCLNGRVGMGLVRILCSNRISWKAKALALFIINNEENIFLNPSVDKEKFILKYSKENIDAVRSGIKELQKVGWLVKEVHRNTEGRSYILGTSWELNPNEAVEGITL